MYCPGRRHRARAVEHSKRFRGCQVVDQINPAVQNHAPRRHGGPPATGWLVAMLSLFLLVLVGFLIALLLRDVR